MLQVWLYSTISVLLVSLFALIGIITLLIQKKHMKGVTAFLVSFAAGALIGDVFIHLLPEIIESQGFNLTVSLSIISGIIVFFILEKVIHWRHCHHDEHCNIHAAKTKSVASMNLIGDAFHNFLDGIIIASSYMITIPLGIATTVAVIFHEIPQEIGDFGVLLHTGYSKSKALFFNFLVSFTSILGAVLTLWFGSKINGFELILIPFTAGSFIYIAGTDLMPELHKEIHISKSLLQLLALILGVIVMLTLTLLK